MRPRSTESSRRRLRGIRASRTLARVILLLLLVVLLSLVACRSVPPGGSEGLAAVDEPRRPPNVVLFLADDLGYGEVGVYGQSLIRTPNWDRLAAEGMRFTRGYSGSPVCAPSRCSLLTGRHTGRSIVRNNWEGGGWDRDAVEGQYPLPEDVPILSEFLAERGYATGVFGKWGLGGTHTDGAPQLQGFDRSVVVNCQRVAHNFYPTHLWSDGERLPLEGNEWFSAHQRIEAPLEDPAEYSARFTGQTYAPDVMLEAALEFLDDHADEPFFLYFPTPLPHVALQVPDEEVQAYPEEWDAETGPYLGQKGYLPHPRPRAAYAAMISRQDAELGALLDRLDALGLADDTLVIATSDNGPTYAGGVDYDFFDSAGGLRGLKGSVYEGGLRVPTIARWPGRIEPASSSDQPVYFADYAETIADAVGADWQAESDGISFLPTLLQDGVQRPHPYMYWELGRRQALISGDWKLVRTDLDKDQPIIELFDLARDPGEAIDLSQAQPEILKLLLGLARGARTVSEPFPIARLDAGE